MERTGRTVRGNRRKRNGEVCGHFGRLGYGGRGHKSSALTRYPPHGPHSQSPSFRIIGPIGLGSPWAFPLRINIASKTRHMFECSLR